MLHHGRCGSTVVGNLLAQNSNIHWASELYTSRFEKWEKAEPKKHAHLEKKPIIEKSIEILKNSINTATKPYYGVEIKPIQFRFIGYSATNFLAQARFLNFTHFILLRRKNILRFLVSIEVATKHNFWFQLKKKTELKKINFSIKKYKYLSESIEGIKTPMQEVDSLLKGKNILNLTYENDIEQDPKKAYRRICRFINIKPTKVSVNLSKTNPFPLADILENFDEIRAALHNTPYEWMLDS